MRLGSRKGQQGNRRNRQMFLKRPGSSLCFLRSRFGVSLGRQGWLDYVNFGTYFPAFKPLPSIAPYSSLATDAHRILSDAWQKLWPLRLKNAFATRLRDSATSRSSRRRSSRRCAAIRRTLVCRGECKSATQLATQSFAAVHTML